MKNRNLSYGKEKHLSHLIYNEMFFKFQLMAQVIDQLLHWEILTDLLPHFVTALINVWVGLSDED